MNLSELRSAATRNQIDPSILLTLQPSLSFQVSPNVHTGCPYAFRIDEITDHRPQGDDGEFQYLKGMDLFVEEFLIHRRQLASGDWLVHATTLAHPLVLTNDQFTMLYRPQE